MPAANPITLRLAATPVAVRDAMAATRAHWQSSGLDEEACGVAEQVLAEVLNNVVEHAQAGRPDGVVELAIHPREAALACTVRDDGAPMPGGKLPAGLAANVDADFDDLPEGGFGWFMIRSLTENLDYQRKSGWNCLRFDIPANAWHSAGMTGDR